MILYRALAETSGEWVVAILRGQSPHLGFVPVDVLYQAARCAAHWGRLDLATRMGGEKVAAHG